MITDEYQVKCYGLITVQTKFLLECTCADKICDVVVVQICVVHNGCVDVHTKLKKKEI